ncbi:MAG: DUF1232 domain-containing protein [Gemmatimonadetes bacterium]|nr:DUF1232 domain-containing protein [Gemmatimonadota bacterium]
MISNLPNFVRLLARLFGDPRVAKLDKALFGLVLLYVIVPSDLVPDFFWMLGLVDDVFLIGLALRRMLSRAGPDVLLEHWDGDPRELGYLVEQVDAVGRLLPGTIRKVLTRTVRRAG